MHIIFDRATAEELKTKFTILELETFDVEGKQLECFCVVPAEKMNLAEMPKLEENIKLHNTFLETYRRGEKDACLEYGNMLVGKFGGELDSFYEILMNRLA
jgi:hypothetical protein